MSPRYGQPIKEEPRVARVMVNFTVDEKQQLEDYCKKNNIKLSELCRKEVLKVLKDVKKDTELRKLRKEADRKGMKIAKGYRKTRIDGKYVLDESGNKIVGYMITDNTNAFLEGTTSEELYTMDFEELVSYFNQK